MDKLKLNKQDIMRFKVGEVRLLIVNSSTRFPDLPLSKDLESSQMKHSLSKFKSVSGCCGFDNVSGLRAESHLLVDLENSSALQQLLIGVMP